MIRFLLNRLQKYFCTLIIGIFEDDYHFTIILSNTKALRL